MRAREGSRRDAGFTLIEMLVAMAIIGLLAGLLMTGVSAARRSARAHDTQAMIEQLKLALEAYRTDFGDYPPTSLSALGIPGNGRNEGSESLLRCLTTREGRGPYIDPTALGRSNTDGDSSKLDPTHTALETRDLQEIADAFGNPIIYFHARDYRGGARIEEYVKSDMSSVRCRPRADPKTGQYPSPMTYEIWSLGPDGQDDGGEGDDIRSW